MEIYVVTVFDRADFQKTLAQQAFGFEPRAQQWALQTQEDLNASIPECDREFTDIRYSIETIEYEG